MEDSVVGMMMDDAPAMEITDKIKELLMQKAMERIEAVRPPVVSQMFELETEEEE